jgi:Domain of unknown function (DUF1841)
VSSDAPSDGSPGGGYSREQLRRSYVDAWRKYLARSPLSPLESLIAGVIALHPEYHAVVADPASALRQDSDAGSPQENPFLHMGLHIAVREQLAIDRPPGILELHRRLAAHLGEAHRADHALMEALAETLWEAQRSGRPPDESRYLELARLSLER